MVKYMLLSVGVILCVSVCEHTSLDKRGWDLQDETHMNDITLARAFE